MLEIYAFLKISSLEKTANRILIVCLEPPYFLLPVGVGNSTEKDFGGQIFQI